MKNHSNEASRNSRFGYKLVVVVRNDLGISHGKMAAQVAHAAVSCALECRKGRKEWFDEWYAEGQRKVVLKAKSEDELHALEREARSRKLTTALIADAGLTEVPPGTVTCLGIGPAPEGEIDRVTGSLPLL